MRQRKSKENTSINEFMVPKCLELSKILDFVLEQRCKLISKTIRTRGNIVLGSPCKWLASTL